MTTAQSLATYVPYLRRYARALCGTQTAGDAYVAATLETLIAAPQTLDASSSPKVTLYKTFTSVWNTISANSREVEGPGNIAAQTTPPALDVLTPLPRQAFLLTSMEGFNNADAGDILGVTTSEIEALVSEAGREMGQHIATDVLIIEDEPLIAIDLENVVENLGHRITNVARTHKEALDAVKTQKPGLILADIQLADGSSGLDAVNDLLTELNVPVIFITAYPERLLTGERPEPAFLLTKPYNPTMLSAVISQALFFEKKAGKMAA